MEPILYYVQKTNNEKRIVLTDEQADYIKVRNTHGISQRTLSITRTLENMLYWWQNNILNYIIRFSSLCKIFTHLHFLAKAFRCHVHHFQCLANGIGFNEVGLKNKLHQTQFHGD